MPKRVIRDWTDSYAVNSLTAVEERFLIRLMMKADDYGLCTADPKLLRAGLFPLLVDNVRVSDVTRWIAACETAGLLRTYTVNNKQYLEIINFGQRLDKAKPKHPFPPKEKPKGNDPPEHGNEFHRSETSSTDPKAEVEVEVEVEVETETEISSGKPKISGGKPPVREHSVLGYKECVEFWLKDFHPDWQFQAIHGRKMKSLVGKIRKSITKSGKDPTPESISDAFQMICRRLPDWFKDKDLQVIDQKYNEIISQIKNAKNAETNSKRKRVGDSIFNPFSPNYIG